MPICGVPPAYWQAGLSFVIAAYVQVRLVPQDFACLRVAASAEAGEPCTWPFLSNLGKKLF
jgi:hypothetical protein